MATFEGHAVVGAIFLVWGLWWAVINAVKLFNQNSAIYSPKLLFFLENVALTITTFIGLLVQQFALHGPGLHLYNEQDHRWVDLKRWQHSTIYLFFLISSLGCILTQCPFRLPLGLDRLLLSLALFNEGMIFVFHHIMATTPLDKHIHIMLLIPIFSAAFCLLLEVHFRDQPILELFRTSMFLTQGTWFWQIAFVLFPLRGAPLWDPNDTETIMFLTICFSWHYLAALFLLFIIYAVVYCYFNSKRKYEATNTELELFNQDRRAYVLLPNKCSED